MAAAYEKSTETYWINDVEGAVFDPRDPGLWSGLSVFETMRTYGTDIFRMKYHYERLCKSAVSLKITPPKWTTFASRLDSKAEENVRLRYLLTRGQQEVIYRAPLKPSDWGRNIHLGVLYVMNSDALPGNVKHGSRAEWVLSAEQQGVDEVLLCSPEGEIFEANRSAFFGFRNGKMCLPPEDGKRLASVTLNALIEVAHELGIEMERKALSLRDHFDEVYVASTLKGLSPVLSIGDQCFQGLGPFGQRLHNGFKAIINRECPTWISRGLVQDGTM